MQRDWIYKITYQCNKKILYGKCSKNLLAYTETEQHLCKMKVTYMVIINRLLPPTKAYALQRTVLLYKLVKDHKQPWSWFTEFSTLFLSLPSFYTVLLLYTTLWKWHFFLASSINVDHQAVSSHFGDSPCLHLFVESRSRILGKSRQKSLEVSCLHSHLCSFALIFLFLQIHATSSSFCKGERRTAW